MASAAMTQLAARAATSATNALTRTASSTTSAHRANVTKVEQTDTNIGSALGADANPDTISAVLTTLGPVALYAGIFFAVFLLLRRFFPRTYSPRSILTSLRPQERTPPLPRGWLDWLGPFFLVSDVHVLQSQSLDSYLFLRHLRLAVICSLVGMVITWPILFPVNATGPGKWPQLNRISMSNAVSEAHPRSYYRYFAHTFCAYIFFGFLLFMITRETIYYINLRQAYLVSPLYADRISSRTVMYTAVTEDYLQEDILREILGRELVENVWIPRNTKQLEDLVSERDELIQKLENAETSLIKKANKARTKKLRKQQRKRPDEDVVRLRTLHDSHGEKSSSASAQWLRPKDRPTHRLGFMGLYGEKVDTIDWCREQLRKKIPEVEEMQRSVREGRFDGKLLHSCFVQFKSLRDAQSAYQSLTHHQPLHMAPRFTGIFPSEIIWANLRIKWWERVIRYVVTTCGVVALIIFWSLPVAAIGAISSITNLVDTFPELSFLNNIPKWLVGVVNGLLPAVLLAVLFWILPVILRLAANIAGAPTKSDIEYTVQNSYFAFQVVQVFLITTLSNGALKVAAGIIDNPTSIFSTLGQALPAASSFYFCYFIVQGLGVVSQTLLSLSSFVLFWVMSKFLDGTPRKMYKRWTELSDPQLGTLFPIYTNLFVIAICYACIAPLVLLFSSIGLYLFYLAYRYNFLYVYTSEIDLKGLMYARALQQLFVGIYLAEICMIGIFAVGIGGYPAALGPFVLMIILLAFTAIFHVSLNEAVGPLLRYLPKTLEAEEKRLLAIEERDAEAEAAAAASASDSSGGSAVDKVSSRAMDKPLPPAPMSAGDHIPPPKPRPSVLRKFLRPDLYTDYYTMRKLVPRDFVTIEYDEETTRRAYFHPAVYAEKPTIWIPTDPAGVSEEEIRSTPPEVAISNKGAFLDGKNRLHWDVEHASELPLYEEKIYY